MDVGIVKKNSYDFSAVKEVLNEVNNNEFKSGESDFYSLLEGHFSVDTSKSYIWTALSAVADDTMEALYQNVLNYIDNASNIDTCTVKALQSMVQILGTKFSVFDSLSKCPPEVMNLIDVFSMRKDYLLNSEKVCQHLVDELSAGEESVLTTKAFDDRTEAEYISCKALDNLISCTFYDVLSTHVYRTYGSSVNVDYIYQSLSDDILNNGFEIPNAYADLIQSYKLKWNIGSEFDTDLEADNIDNGLSALEDYTDREQAILSVEFARRKAAKYELEPKSRFAYYKELDVKNYFSFIEETYNESYNVYSASEPYDIDKNYIEVNTLSSAKLLSKTGNGAEIDSNMLSSVAGRLQQIVTQIRAIREYLKSHAQRNYMKGTFLLLSYIVNEYLRNNVYPILPELGYHDTEFVTDKNKLELVEYIDQTQYNNIQTDIEEDDDDKSLNPPYWKDNGANGAAIALDSTNVFRPADKLKVVTPTTFAEEEIEDFYINILNNQTGISRLSTHESLYDFLTTLFKVGADNSYMTADGKVMCELQNTAQTDSAEEWNSSRRFTKDIDKYILELSAAQDACAYLMNGYEPLPNITYQTQIDEIQTFYSEKAAAAYTDQLDAKIAELNAEVQKCNEFSDEVHQLIEQFNELTAQFSNLVVSNIPYTGEFIIQSTRFRDNISRYSDLVDSCDFSQKSQVQEQLYQIENQNDLIFNQANSLLSNEIIISANLGQITFNDYILSSYYQILTQPTTIESYFMTLHSYGIEDFEDIKDSVLTDINSLQTQLQSQISDIFLNITNAIISHKANSQYSELRQLAALLSQFLYDQNDIRRCTQDVAKKLDYTASDWYKYKESLFNKYTGLSTSDLPFYYVENTKHPSYQIHPCLSNFIEYVDYSFPIKNLAGLAQKTISDIANTAAQLSIDNNGYLKDIWNNPLNSNQDYLTRYEKSSHIDELGNVNKHFGFDGMLYPDITDMSNIADADTDSRYSGLNISKAEVKLINEKLSKFQPFYAKLHALKDKDIFRIKRYANDVYGNSYILLSTPNSGDAGILMFRAKNYPIAFPAIVYDNDHKYAKNLSEIDLTYNNANEYFNQLSCIQLLGQFTENNETIDKELDVCTPLFADFTFATDKTTMILNGFLSSKNQTAFTYRTSIPVIANIIQEFQMDIDKQYFVRTFARDKTDHSLQHLEIPSDLSPEAYYYDGRHIGQIYASLTRNKLKLGVCKYFHDNVNAQYKTTNFVSAEFGNIQANDISKIKFSCRSNGTFSIAYIPEDGSIENTMLSSYTGSQIDEYSNLTSTINTFDKLIRTHDFAPVFESETILMTGTQNYAPYVDMGFIRLADYNNIKWELSSTAFSKDFIGKKPLQFEFDIPLNNVGTSARTMEQLKKSNVKHGIDFKFICPIRVEEIEAGDTDETKLNVDDQYTNIAFTTNYGKYPLPTTIKLKHYAVTDVHMYDTIYNQYVLSGHIPEWLDLDGYEQTLFDHPNGDRATVFTEYIDLMRYDVARYLSAQCEEYGNGVVDIADYARLSDVFSDGRYQYMMTEPFFVSESQWNRTDGLSASSYVNGNVSAYTDSVVDYTGHYRFSLADGIEISAEVMKNDYGTVKIDFNPIYYFRPQDTDVASNIANRMHLFLNLDKPGDSGYLNIYEKGTNDRITLKTKPAVNILATVFIKNISTTVPRFVLKAVYLHTDSNERDDQHFIEVVAEKESHMFRAENQQQHQEYVLTDESLEALPIDLS